MIQYYLNKIEVWRFLEFGLKFWLSGHAQDFKPEGPLGWILNSA